MKTNPYIAGNPVGGESAFIGRADVLRDVLRVLRNEQENGMVLYGQRRIGKTSVLQELKTVLPQQGNFAPVYFDLQDKAALSLDQVLAELANRILYTLDIPAADIPKEDFSSVFQDIFLPHVLSHLPEQTALVLLLDEFDVLDNPGNKQAGTDFFPYLRNLMTKDVRRLQFVFVIGRRPEDLASVYLSLFKGVKSSHVSLMSEKDTAELVRLSEKNDSLKWTDDAAAQVYHLSGGHPFLTQQLCQVIWNNLYDDDPEEPPTVQPDDVNNAIQEAIRTATNSLEWLWNGLQPAQRIVASALAEAGPKLITQQELEKHLHDSGVRILIGELQDAPRVLAEWDVIQPEDGGYRMRVEMLRQWIAERKPLSRVRDEMDRILPAAENLFQAAYAIYQGGQLDEAEPLLRQSVRLNPNHLKANQLLAEILLAKENTDEALQILETLYEYNPQNVKHRLVQILMDKAKEAKGYNERILLYEKILKIEPNQTDALDFYQEYYENQGVIALKCYDFDQAIELYKKAHERKSENFQTQFIKALLNQAKMEKDEKNRLTFYDKILELEPKHPEVFDDYKKIYENHGDKAYNDNEFEKALELYEKACSIEKIEIVKRRLLLENSYQQAINALERNDKEKAQTLLVEVLSIEPSFKEATRYMHLAVTNVDINEQIEIVSTQLNSLQNIVNRLENKLKQYRDTENNRWYDEAEVNAFGFYKKSNKKKNLQKENSDSENLFNRLENEINKLDKEKSGLQDQVNALEKEKMNLQNDNSELKNMIHTFETGASVLEYKNRINAFEREKLQLEKAIKGLERENSNLKNRINGFEFEKMGKSELENKLKQLEKENSELQYRIKGSPIYDIMDKYKTK